MVDLDELEATIDLEDHEWELGSLAEAVETAFGIRCSPEDLQVGSTYREVFELMKAKLGDLGSPACLTSIAFYRLRAELARMTGRDKKQIRPDTLLAELFPWKGRRARWRQLGVATGLTMPKLASVDWVLNTQFWVPVWLSLGMFAARQTVVLECCVLGWIVLAVLGRPLHRDLPRRLLNVGDLARSVAGRNHAKLSRDAGGTTEKQLRRAFQEVAAEVAGVDPSLIRLDAESTVVGVVG